MYLLNSTEYRRLFSIRLFVPLFILLASTSLCLAEVQKKSIGIGLRAGKSIHLEPDDIESLEIFADYEYPWRSFLIPGFIVNTKSSVSAGLLKQDKDEQLLTTLSQLMVLTNRGKDISFDLGGGIAILGNDRVGDHDFGNIFQFNYNFGITLLDLYRGISLGYRWFHLSDAGIENGHGLNRHTIQIEYNF